MTFGIITRKIRTAIQSELSNHEHVLSAWGFGSFFRLQSFEDIDVLVVVSCKSSDLPSLSAAIRRGMYVVGIQIGFSIDLLILTSGEFDERPLRDFDQLESIFIRQSTIA